MSDHKLVAGTLLRESGGIVARCTCGWVSGGHFSSMGASAAMMDHKEKCDRRRAPQESDSD